MKDIDGRKDINTAVILPDQIHAWSSENEMVVI